MGSTCQNVRPISTFSSKLPYSLIINLRIVQERICNIWTTGKGKNLCLKNVCVQNYHNSQNYHDYQWCTKSDDIMWKAILEMLLNLPTMDNLEWAITTFILVGVQQLTYIFFIEWLSIIISIVISYICDWFLFLTNSLNL